VVCPFFAVSRLQGSFNQPQEAVVLDVFLKDVPQDGMVDIIEASFDVSFNKPFSPYPNVAYFGEGCLASPFRSESVAMF
jgi:hypothetical protein